ncbi:hypothetical protein PMM47T1_28066 [Pseudomonas sp. M47T1]|uniref:hypothetical protein n=1 Tax=Pseudomonas sp. M47T1 TaxID=1179778 RepID=UPI0002608426|nr:hypothetical protein [Pseudomonas sp. M47T1]EIK93224.1 hypothetical protein PMM47T1_28066 [Pseudomonas sp. M47T1]
MSEVKNIESVYVLAIFPKKGRLPSDPQSVINNYDLQMAETEKCRQELNAKHGLRVDSRYVHNLFLESANEQFRSQPLQVLNERRLGSALFVPNLITNKE